MAPKTKYTTPKPSPAGKPGWEKRTPMKPTTIKPKPRGGI